MYRKVTTSAMLTQGFRHPPLSELREGGDGGGESLGWGGDGLGQSGRGTHHRGESNFPSTSLRCWNRVERLEEDVLVLRIGERISQLGRLCVLLAV